MIYWGINALNHDASIAVFKDKELLWHRRAGEFSNIEHDHYLNQDIINEALKLGTPDEIYWYERPLIKKTRQLYAGQYRSAFSINDLPVIHLRQFGIKTPIKYVSHHKSHAAAGYYTSPFERCAVVVLDAIGEWESSSIWVAQGGEMTKFWSKSYPNSLGLYYSAFTELVGFTPCKEEHKLQALSNEGNPAKYRTQVQKYFDGLVDLKYNLHCGVLDWPNVPKSRKDRGDVAAAVQEEFENQVLHVMELAREWTQSRNLVFMGGCAMNTKLQEKIKPRWDSVWTLNPPGDSSSAIGAVLAEKQFKVKI